MKQTMFGIALILLAGALPGASEPSTDSELVVTRVLYLQDVAISDAMKLLRSEARVQVVAALTSQDALVVADTRDVVELSESLLVAEGALARSAEPHGARSPGGPSTDAPRETRIFRFTEPELPSFATLLRSVYRIRELSLLAEESAISVTSTPEHLERIEAMLGELDVLESVSLAP